MDPVPLLAGVVSLFVLIALNATFVFAEYSLAVSRRTRIAELADHGSARAQVVRHVMTDPDRFFAATQIGVTLTSVAIGVVSEPAFREGLTALLAGLGAAWPPGALAALGGLAGLLLASFFQIVLGELVPRSITLRNAERVALICVPPMNVLASGLRPAIWLLKGASRLVLRGLGFAAAPTEQPLYSINELRMLVAASGKGGLIESDQRDMLDAVFGFGDITVREVMVPRTEMACVPADALLDEVVQLLARQPFSRIPVYEGSPDDIVGVLHVKDVMPALLAGAKPASVRQLMREALFVPDTQRADELLRQFRARRQYLAIVLDEYGGTAGLVTLGDLVAEIVGGVDDQTGRAPEIQVGDDGTAVVDGLATIHDVNAALQLHLADEHSETIGGLVMSRLGRIPRAGDVVLVPEDQVRLSVVEMDKLRVARLRIGRL